MRLSLKAQVVYNYLFLILNRTSYSLYKRVIYSNKMSIKSYFLSSKNNDEERANKKFKLNPSSIAKEDSSLTEVSLTGTNLEESTTTDQKIKEILKEETKEGCSVVWNPFSELSGDWRGELTKEVNKPYFSKLTSFLATEIRSKKVYPECNQLFTAFNLCQLSSLKVVIIGQDPYHGRGQVKLLIYIYISSSSSSSSY